MKKLMQIGLLFSGLAGFGLAALAADQKIATFNLGKAYDSYYKAIQSDLSLKAELTEAQKEEAKMIETARQHDDELRQLIDKANDQAVSVGERDKSKKAADDKRAELEVDQQSIKEFDRRTNLHLQSKEEQRRQEIIKEIRDVVNAHAKAGGYSMVLDTTGSATHVPVVLWSNGQDDLTDPIIKELNAAAPPGSLDTNALAAPTTNPLNPANTSK